MKRDDPRQSDAFPSISLHPAGKAVGHMQCYALHLHAWHMKVRDISVLRGQPRKNKHQSSLGSVHRQTQRQTQLGMQTVPCPEITGIAPFGSQVKTPRHCGEKGEGKPHRHKGNLTGARLQYWLLSSLRDSLHAQHKPFQAEHA